MCAGASAQTEFLPLSLQHPKYASAEGSSTQKTDMALRMMGCCFLSSSKEHHSSSGG